LTYVIQVAIQVATDPEEEDNQMSNIIETTAPIDINHLKEYFQDKTISFLIEYDQSSLKGEKLLTYLSNLDIPADIKFESEEGMHECLEAYLHSTSLVNIYTLELLVIAMLLEHVEFPQYKEILDFWKKRLNSLPTYNLYIVNDENCKKFAESHEHDDTKSLEGINWVSLLKNADFYDYYNNADIVNVKFFENYFNEYMFKGKNLYDFWANANNPMFLLMWGFVTSVSDNR